MFPDNDLDKPAEDRRYLSEQAAAICFLLALVLMLAGITANALVELWKTISLW